MLSSKARSSHIKRQESGSGCESLAWRLLPFYHALGSDIPKAAAPEATEEDQTIWGTSQRTARATLIRQRPRSNQMACELFPKCHTSWGMVGKSNPEQDFSLSLCGRSEIHFFCQEQWILKARNNTSVTKIMLHYTLLNLTIVMFTLILRYLGLSAGHQNWPLGSTGFPRCSSCASCHCDGTLPKISLGKRGLNWLAGYNSSRSTGSYSRNSRALLAGLLSVGWSAFLYNPCPPVWQWLCPHELGPPISIINWENAQQTSSQASLLEATEEFLFPGESSFVKFTSIPTLQRPLNHEEKRPRKGNSGTQQHLEKSWEV